MVVKRAALLFHSFCSNVSKQAARFCWPLYWTFTRDTTACNIMNVFVKESSARPLIKQLAVSRFSSKIIECTRTTRAARTWDARNEGISLRRENRNSALACGKDKGVHTNYTSSKDSRREKRDYQPWSHVASSGLANHVLSVSHFELKQKKVYKKSSLFLFTFNQYFAITLALVLVCSSTMDCLCWVTANCKAFIPFWSICFRRSWSAFSCWALRAFRQATKHLCRISVCQKVTALEPEKTDKSLKQVVLLFVFNNWLHLC